MCTCTCRNFLIFIFCVRFVLFCFFYRLVEYRNIFRPAKILSKNIPKKGQNVPCVNHTIDGGAFYLGASLCQNA